MPNKRFIQLNWGMLLFTLLKSALKKFDPEGPILQPPVKPSFTFNGNQTNQKSNRN